tara:strand:+ start:5000 stop:6400 length:1401 start_codon:yes stop_codon:yes gene_type:complete
MKKNKSSSQTRFVQDSMGKIEVPYKALYGAQTQRAKINFPISGLKLPKEFINSIIIIKRSAAIVNFKLDKINLSQKNAIVKACDYLLKNDYKDEFPVDVFQTGSGTSTNMNVNEVISSVANSISKNKRKDIHPNDHVNMGQSSNDVIPTAVHISTVLLVNKTLIPELIEMEKVLLKKEREFKDILKIGRTHLQDATPMTLGQEFSGYKYLISKNIKRINTNKVFLYDLAQGGTAVGTGINTHKKFGKLIANEISDFTGIKFQESKNHFEAQSTQDGIVAFSGDIKALAVALSKIANDIRWLSSGPRSGLGEISIPSVQPGSSIMPGKVNPVICESMLQVCAQVISNDAAITLGGLGSYFELNLMLPLIAHNILFSISILSNSINVFNSKLLAGIKADKKKCEDYIEGSLAMCTSLAPVIGYDSAAEIAYEAYNSGKTIRQVLKDKKILSDKEISKILDPKSMIKPK